MTSSTAETRDRASGLQLVAVSLRQPATVVTVVVATIAVTVRFLGDAALPALLFVAGSGAILARIDLDVRRLPFDLTVPAFPITAVLLAIGGVVDGDLPIGRGRRGFGPLDPGGAAQTTTKRSG